MRAVCKLNTAQGHHAAGPPMPALHRQNANRCRFGEKAGMAHLSLLITVPTPCYVADAVTCQQLHAAKGLSLQALAGQYGDSPKRHGGVSFHEALLDVELDAASGVLEGEEGQLLPQKAARHDPACHSNGAAIQICQLPIG